MLCSDSSLVLPPSFILFLCQWLNAVHLFFSIIKLRCDFITKLWLSLCRLELFSRFFCSLACVLFIFSLLSHLIFSLTNVSVVFSGASKNCRPVNQLLETVHKHNHQHKCIDVSDYTASSFTLPFNLYTVSITMISLPVRFWMSICSFLCGLHWFVYSINYLAFANGPAVAWANTG